MPSASKSRRGRSRKRRPAPGSEALATQQEVSAAQGKASSAQLKASPARQKTPTTRQKAPLPSSRRGERPQAPWHPLPLAEILILLGAIATIVGLNRRSEGTALLVVGLVSVGIGTFEVTVREHLSGYRSHTILLALVPVLAFHSLAIAIASIFANPTVLLSIVLLPFDLALFVFCFKLLRARFLDARQLRTVGRR